MKATHTANIWLKFALVITLISCNSQPESSQTEQEFTLTTTASPAEAGEIAPQTGSFDRGEQISLQANAADGWVFSHWEQDLSTTANPINIKMTQHYNVVAVFDQSISNNEAWRRDTETAVVDVYNPATGQTWMDRNLGATRVASSSTDSEAYGDLYEWGRAADGHEKRNSPTNFSQSSSDQPGHGDFILFLDDEPRDCRSPQNYDLWHGASGINNPCPSGYRLPTAVEWEAERESWDTDDASGAFNSELKLPLSPARSRSDGSVNNVFSYGNYWSSSVTRSLVRSLSFSRGFDDMRGYAEMIGNNRAHGRSVRCIKD